MKLACLIPWFVCSATMGQETVQITFDGPPVQPQGTGSIITNYYESGMLFQPAPGARGFSRYGAPTDPRDPDDGTAFARASIGQSLMFSFTNGSLFALASVDLAGYSSVVPDGTVDFVGIQADGSTVPTNFPVSGIIFSTFYFGPEFTNLTRVEIPNSLWSLDNVVVIKAPMAPPPPALTITALWYSSPAQARKHAVRLSWPTNTDNRLLLFSTNLTLTIWTPISPPPVVLGTNYVMTNEITGPQKFYRLSGS